jgi:hypothetical protein
VLTRRREHRPPRGCARTLATLILLVACDSGGGPDPATAAAEAKAKEDAELAQRLEERRKEREAKAEAKARQDAEHAAALDALAVLPDAMPKDFDKACKTVGDAQLAFFERHYTGEALEKLRASAGTAIPMTVANCKKTGKLEVAACQKQALDRAPPELKEDLASLLRVCIDKFGDEQPGGTVPPQ